MTWIRTVPYTEATGRPKDLYHRIKGPDENVDNIMVAHSLRPHTMDGHLALYKNVLHHSANRLPRWFVECLGVYVSLLNGCDYCVEHHREGMRRRLGDDARAEEVMRALESGDLGDVFTRKELVALSYARCLTKTPADIGEGDVAALREAGYDDGEVLEVNQIVSYFAYANRVVLGLGVSTDGDVLGLSPSSEAPDDWSHR